MEIPGITDLNVTAYLRPGGVDIYVPSPDFFGYDRTSYAFTAGTGAARKTAESRSGTRPEGGTVLFNLAHGRYPSPADDAALLLLQVLGLMHRPAI